MSLYEYGIEINIQKDCIQLIHNKRVIFSAVFSDAPQTMQFEEVWKIVGELILGIIAAR